MRFYDFELQFVSGYKTKRPVHTIKFIIIIFYKNYTQQYKIFYVLKNEITKILVGKQIHACMYSLYRLNL